jgi:hypothetical protein
MDNRGVQHGCSHQCECRRVLVVRDGRRSGHGRSRSCGRADVARRRPETEHAIRRWGVNARDWRSTAFHKPIDRLRSLRRMARTRSIHRHPKVLNTAASEERRTKSLRRFRTAPLLPVPACAPT